jgi:hypothetical protein
VTVRIPKAMAITSQTLISLSVFPAQLDSIALLLELQNLVLQVNTVIEKYQKVPIVLWVPICLTRAQDTNLIVSPAKRVTNVARLELTKARNS